MLSFNFSETVSGDRSISPTDGNVVDITTNSMQASLLRKNLSELSVTYVTCHVSDLFPSLSLPEILRMTAPRILIPLLLAACILSLKCYRDEFISADSEA